MVKAPKINLRRLNLESIALAAKLLRENNIVIFPTDTVYGILANATSKEAVQKVINFKARTPDKPISVFFKDLDQMMPYVQINPRTLTFLKKLLPGPYTVILKLSKLGQKTFMPPIKTDRNTIGVRIVGYDPLEKLLNQLDFPVTATSANLSGKGPYNVLNNLIRETPLSNLQEVSLFIQGKEPLNLTPSTVIDMSQDPYRILRKGAEFKKAILTLGFNYLTGTGEIL